MPNTLVHFGIQGLLNRGMVRNIDVKWVFVGCVIPDVPWILQRVLRFGFPLDPYQVRLYAIVQASFLGCLILSASLACLSSLPWQIFLILAGNSFLHLLLDALQIKWANGVHVLAPVSWQLFNAGLFWPESLLNYVFTVFGLGFVGWTWRKSMTSPLVFVTPNFAKIALCLIFFFSYVLIPFALVEGPLTADNHFVETLQDTRHREGRAVEFDRVPFVQDKHMIQTLTGENLKIIGKAPRQSGLVSIRGTFVNEHTVRVLEIHEHSLWFRDIASILGLGLLVILCVGSAFSSVKGAERNSSPTTRGKVNSMGRKIMFVRRNT